MIWLGSFGHCSEGKCVFDQFGNLEISSGRSHVTATEQGDTTDIEPGSPFGQFRGQEIAKQREERCKHENWRKTVAHAAHQIWEASTRPICLSWSASFTRVSTSAAFALATMVAILSRHAPA